jgi:hypothetical protein
LKDLKPLTGKGQFDKRIYVSSKLDSCMQRLRKTTQSFHQEQEPTEPMKVSKHSSIKFNGVEVPKNAESGELFDGRIKVTNYGLISGDGQFLSTYCQPFNYQKQGSMPMAQTFYKPSKSQVARSNQPRNFTSIFDSRLQRRSVLHTSESPTNQSL